MVPGGRVYPGGVPGSAYPPLYTHRVHTPRYTAHHRPLPGVVTAEHAVRRVRKNGALGSAADYGDDDEEDDDDDGDVARRRRRVDVGDDG